jgi:hypothetical protein
MNITITLSDRTKARKFTVDHAADCDLAIGKMVGKRFMSASVAEWNESGTFRAYNVMVRTGPTRNGSTPFANIRATVDLA